MVLGKKSLFCFGPGYSATFIARSLQAQGWHISATYRNAEGAKNLTKQNIEPVAFDDVTENHILGIDAILSSIPPNAEGDPVLASYGVILKNLNPNIWIGYLSTTGVYGNTNGAIVDETAPLNPSNDRSRWRMAAENDWLNFSSHVFRLAGIYGPGRSSFDRYKPGARRPIKYRISHPNHLFSRIHAEDIAQTVIASLNQPHPGAIYNLCDDEAAEQQDVEAYAANLLGIAPPPLIPFEEALKEMSPMAKTFWQDNRRVDNTKIKKELGVELHYPTYREGLKAIHQSSNGAGETI